MNIKNKKNCIIIFFNTGNSFILAPLPKLMAAPKETFDQVWFSVFFYFYFIYMQNQHAFM